MSDGVNTDRSDGSRKIFVPFLTKTSPTLAESMRVCMLRAGLSRAQGIEEFTLGTPKAWLGIAYHEVLAALASRADELSVHDLWTKAIATQYERARHHPLDARFGPPPSWPGYHVMFATLQLRAQQMQGGTKKTKSSSAGAKQVRSAYRETYFSAFDGKLVGKPDLVINKKIIDYKTGSVADNESVNQGLSRPAFVRQLMLYAYLVFEGLGFWPEEAEVIPMFGPPVQIRIDEAACRAEASEAVNLLESYNDTLRSGKSDALANPSPGACKWCPFKLLCNPFWQQVSPVWSGQLDGEAVDGYIIEGPITIHAGLAISITVNAVEGTMAGRTVVTPLKPTDALSVASRNTPVRAVSLYKRPDGKVTPTIRSQVANRSHLPSIVAGAVQI